MMRKVIFLLVALSTILAAASAAVAPVPNAAPVSKAPTTTTGSQIKKTTETLRIKEEIGILEGDDDDIYDDLDTVDPEDLDPIGYADEDSLDGVVRYDPKTKPSAGRQGAKKMEMKNAKKSKKTAKKAKKTAKKGKRTAKKAKKPAKKAKKTAEKSKKTAKKPKRIPRRRHRRRRARKPAGKGSKKKTTTKKGKRTVKPKRKTKGNPSKKRTRRRRRRVTTGKRKANKGSKSKQRKMRRKKQTGKRRKTRGGKRLPKGRKPKKGKVQKKRYRIRRRGGRPKQNYPSTRPATTKRMYTTRRSSTKATTKPTGYIGGQNDKYPPQCRCRPVKDRGGICYDMTNGKHVGRCKRRDCGKSYECVTSKGKGLKNCYRRYAFEEVRVIQSYRGMHKCKRVKYKIPKVFYSPYY